MAAVKILVWFITILVLVFLVGFRDMIKTGNCLVLVFYLKPKVATACVLKVSFRLVNHSTHDLLSIINHYFIIKDSVQIIQSMDGYDMSWTVTYLLSN